MRSLMSVTKIGCLPEVAGRQYLCDFTQEIVLVAVDESWHEQVLASNSVPGLPAEVSDLRFVKAVDGWTVIWGDLRR